ncbi:MAG: hypothetical protein ACI9JY_001213 [Saprospiraceae bacterium]|jgi:hypothetical protein
MILRFKFGRKSHQFCLKISDKSQLVLESKPISNGKTELSHRATFILPLFSTFETVIMYG